MARQERPVPGEVSILLVTTEKALLTGREVVAAEALAGCAAMARGAFSPNTIRAWRADWEIFSVFCHKYRLTVLPAAAKTVRDFVFECVGLRKKPATIRRYVATTGRAHRAAGVLDPTTSEDVKLALKEMSRGLLTENGLVGAAI